MIPADLETLLDRELQRLPSPRAPHTLLPRVIAAVQEWSGRPWYAREWLTWPLGWKVASMAVLLLTVAGSTMLVPGMYGVASDATAALSARTLNNIVTITQQVEATMNAARLVWRAVLEPYVAYLLAIVVLMSLACVAFGAALNRVILGRAFQL
jgi:hypothetical protein